MGIVKSFARLGEDNSKRQLVKQVTDLLEFAVFD